MTPLQDEISRKVQAGYDRLKARPARIRRHRFQPHATLALCWGSLRMFVTGRV